MDRYLLRKTEIDALPGTPKSHFLNENAKRSNKSLGDMTGLLALGFHIIEIQPGHQSTEFHTHYFEEECLYILEGEAESRIGDTIEKVGAGDFIGYRAAGLPHQLNNTGSAVLKCIVVGQRLANDVCDYPEKQKRIFRNQGLPWNLVSIDDIELP